MPEIETKEYQRPDNTLYRVAYVTGGFQEVRDLWVHDDVRHLSFWTRRTVLYNQQGQKVENMQREERLFSKEHLCQGPFLEKSLFLPYGVGSFGSKRMSYIRPDETRYVGEESKPSILSAGRLEGLQGKLSLLGTIIE